ncbi:DUF2634 domain-containing protein [Lactiplantibacillus paraplantarum]|uniref:DUF2634 domain-containing protein n=1 Tax=Lactiplantibacillus paraplantarum TaxID=60520 RepID=A0AAD0TPA5_9LACO|nr:DUF2634 domain-containing protein [Lactiplantibacillus paraplantarum]AYJ38869.1 DUF2634 domain-containing protein [Lactiplantibacillus paraplantarum]AYJ38923.1 DUF2634 domain-containing protein [Lactiplantibacillus paraplantarum]KRL51364.1 hypothetical protein FD48_GL000044 [Lactiplantibacillus paraplantarum DSM 10667]MCU4683960.1 DUF2634 domain-containing protein [Lactiplantibacillus paraplantarum]MDL2061104.1 DUF2634 domain-containing protein [Lactiplantibacillus paraplantarum]
MADEIETVDDGVTVDDLADEVEEVTLPSRTYQVVDGHIVGMVDDYDAMVQAVDKVMRTERFVFPIYSDQYGNDFSELLGKSFDYATVEVERMLQEALQADDRVDDVVVESIVQVNATTLDITATVETVYGTMSVEKEVHANES